MNDAPKGIQLSRAKGWRKPEGAIVVSRPSMWGNPWIVERVHSWRFDVIHREQRSCLGSFEDDISRIPLTGARYWAVQGYKLHLSENPGLIEAAKTLLRGHDLACWCPLDAPCHRSVLLEVSNS